MVPDPAVSSYPEWAKITKTPMEAHGMPILTNCMSPQPVLTRSLGSITFLAISA